MKCSTSFLLMSNLQELHCVLMMAGDLCTIYGHDSGFRPVFCIGCKGA